MARRKLVQCGGGLIDCDIALRLIKPPMCRRSNAEPMQLDPRFLSAKMGGRRQTEKF